MNFGKKHRGIATSREVCPTSWRTSRTLSKLNEVCDSDDDDGVPSEFANWDDLFGRQASYIEEAEKATDQDVEVHLTKKQTLILSTLVPDEVLLWDNFKSVQPKRFVGVLLMADVSGYTALSERYNNMGKGGTYRLTATLNTYLGALTEIIYGHGGDIIKFAGDAFLALWKTDKRSYLCHTIHSVITCALVIQHSYAKYETDVKVNLKVKLAISAGNLMFAPIGVGIDQSYVIFGLPVIEAKLAESVCASGEVKLTPSSWAHCYTRNYDHIIHADGHVTVRAILYDPKDNDVSKPYLGFNNLLRQVRKANCDNIPEFIFNKTNHLSQIELSKKNDILSLRKAILITEKKDIGSRIRNFMIRPVLTQIDAHQPLEYLTEMRQVSVLFVTLKPKECPPVQLITIVNNSYQLTCGIVYRSMGCVNKIILFDKDVMILVIFGLRGFKHESEARAALQCAYSIQKSLSALDGVMEVSIGVTTGQVYCGVVGHPLRREFTVIGATVNKAARLMCYFRNKISCDETTFVKSQLSKNSFTLQPQIELKGIVSPGKIYEYTEDIRVKEFKNIQTIPPLLNRHNEIECFSNWIKKSQDSFRDFDALLLTGEPRVGKTRILQWFARLSKNTGFNVIHINLTSIHSANSYLALSQIFNQILGVDSEPSNSFTKEQKIVDLLQEYDEDLCYLNNIIKVRFAYHDVAFSTNETMRQEKAEKLISKLLNTLTKSYIILLDDLQHLDQFSWKFISLMLRVHKIFLVLAITRGKFTPVHMWLANDLMKENVKKINLGPLSSEWIPAVACQILDVVAVSNDLCDALESHCKGMPGQVERMIVQLFSSGCIELKKIEDAEIEELVKEDLQFPEPSLLKAQALNIEEQAMLDKFMEEELPQLSVCYITNKNDLNFNIQDHNDDGIIMVQIDVLTPYQQLLLKIASVIGVIISRDLLENIMYENDLMVTARAVKRLFAMKIFKCASAKFNQSRNTQPSMSHILESQSKARNIFKCECNFEYDPENCDNLPKYAYCKVMRFRNKKTRDTCYELLPMNQKKEFHSRIVHYLEENKQKCPDCGGSIIVLLPTTTFEDETNRPQSKQFADFDSDFDRTRISTAKNVRISSQTDISSKSSTDSEIINLDTVSLLNKQISSPQKVSIVQGRLSSRRTTVTDFIFNAMELAQLDAVDHRSFGFEMLRSIIESNKLSDWHNLGIRDSLDQIEEERHSKVFAIRLEKGISTTNFLNCTCAELNIVIHDQLIHHALQAELKIKAIELLLKYCHLRLLADITDQVLEKLAQAEAYCLEKPLSEIHIVAKQDLKRFLGRIYSLRAALFFKKSNIPQAKMYIEKARRIYKLTFSKRPKLLKSLNFYSQKYQSHQKLMMCDSVYCLNVASVVYSAAGDEKISRTCAYYAIYLLQQIDCDLTDFCDAFTIALKLELDRGCPENTLDIERTLKQLIAQMPRSFRADDLYALGKLFFATFHGRVARAELAPAIRAGFRTLVTSNYMQAFHVSVSIIPDLFYIMLSRHRIEEAIEIVQLNVLFSKTAQSQESRTWYFALCMDLILDAGYQLEPPSEIFKYAEYILQKKFQGPSRRRLVVNMWTYFLRIDAERKARRFESEAFSWLARDADNCSLTTLLSALRLTEAKIESLAIKMDDIRKVVDLLELRSIADGELDSIERMCRLTRTIYSRWLRLKGNSISLSGRHAAATVMYNQALEDSKRTHNYMEESLTQAVLSSPTSDWMQRARTSRFQQWQTACDHPPNDWHQHMYTLTTSKRRPVSETIRPK